MVWNDTHGRLWIKTAAGIYRCDVFAACDFSGVARYLMIARERGLRTSLPLVDPDYYVIKQAIRDLCREQFGAESEIAFEVTKMG